jgi:hypothetical protein
MASLCSATQSDAIGLKKDATALRVVRLQQSSSSDASQSANLWRDGLELQYLAGAQLQGYRTLSERPRELTRMNIGSNHCAYDLLMDRSRLS